MKRNIVSSTIAAWIFLWTCSASAQSEGTNQVGLRLGGFSGVSLRHITPGNVGVEGDLMASYNTDWTMLSGLVEKQIPLGKQFVFYLGGGAFFAFDMDYNHEDDDIDPGSPNVGVQGVVGIDYYIEDVPLAIGVDVRPRIAFIYHPYPWDAGISFRYIF